MFIRLGGLLTLIGVALWLYALFDSLTAPADRVRHMPKAIWVIVVLLFADLGAIAWLLLGRPRSTPTVGAATPLRRSPFGWQGGGRDQARGPARSVAPDDDPEFLRRLGDQMRRKPDDPGEEPPH